ncbi:DUF2634 domain-containing protein [uncultured Thiodictyon sp.]|uniref:contractile injection system sheath initiator n=1 Tax=uncultured Thiodictyon sp. TaxID=1846217 RepID=UPI0025F089B1|nr:DUF2634 domain-containing protein [uncultured Thiodictyon sp.]
MSRVKQATIGQGDDLRALAQRELDDAARWVDLARLNDLRLPFIVASYKSADRLPHTAIWGDTILIPWVGNSARVPTPIDNFGVDLALPHGRLAATASGDLALVVGADNVVQALSHRIRTPRGEITYHPEYGSHVALALGLPTQPFISLMAATWVYECLAEEPRIARVLAVDARASGDALQVAAQIDMVGANTPIDLNMVLNP